MTVSQVEDSIYSIQCGYVTGSDARGCVYVIRGGDVLGNVIGTIDRSNSAGVIMELTCYSEVLAYDWESDNSTGTLPVRIHINTTCPSPTTLLPVSTVSTCYDITIVIS